MLREALQFLLDMLLQPFAAVLILRFHLQWLRAPMRNPIGEFIMALTDPIVLRTRRRIPSVRGYDSASFVAALTVETLYLLTTIWVQGFPVLWFAQLGVVVWALVALLKLSIYLLMGATILEALLSWINPHSPIAPMLSTVNRPFTAPLRKHIPPLGNIDFSLFILLIICQLVLILPVGYLESMVRMMLWHGRLV